MASLIPHSSLKFTISVMSRNICCTYKYQTVCAVVLFSGLPQLWVRLVWTWCNDCWKSQWWAGMIAIPLPLRLKGAREWDESGGDLVVRIYWQSPFSTSPNLLITSPPLSTHSTRNIWCSPTDHHHQGVTNEGEENTFRTLLLIEE